MNTLFAQTWYQKDKSYHLFAAGAAAIGGKEVFESFKNWKNARIYSAIELGVSNKNTSFGVAASTPDWTTFKEMSLGLVVQRRALYIGRFETWASLAKGVQVVGSTDWSQFQLAFRERLQLNKALALEASYQQNLDADKHNFAWNKGPGFAFSVIVKKNGNVHSNGKY